MMWVETETVVELQSGIIEAYRAIIDYRANEAYLQFERAVFVLQISFRFRLLELN
jgi:hypothetical protein